MKGDIIMKHQCPCCHKPLDSSPPDQGPAEDMDTLFSCDHCQSVLKWEDQALKVVFESQGEEGVSSEEESAEAQAGAEDEGLLSDEGDELSGDEGLLSDEGDELSEAGGGELLSDEGGELSGEVGGEGLLSDEGVSSEDPISEEDIMEELQQAEAGALQESVKEEEMEAVLEAPAPEESVAPSSVGIATDGEEMEAVLEAPAPEESVAPSSVGIATDGEEGGESPLNELADLSAGADEPESVEAGAEVGAESESQADRQNSPTDRQESPTDRQNLLESTEEGQESTAEANPDFSDVESYGNATATSDKGFLRYDLFIEGVDSHEIKTQVFHVLEDPRFNWSAREILQSEKEGVVAIKNLNPVKVMVLLSELSFLSVQLSWKQYRALDGPAES